MAANAPTHHPPAGEQTETVTPVESKQGTDAPKGMPVVLVVSVVAAAVLMFGAWMIFI